MSWDLPPGTTHRDIEDRFGDKTFCDGCEEAMSVDDLDDDNLCADCAAKKREEDEDKEVLE